MGGGQWKQNESPERHKVQVEVQLQVGMDLVVEKACKPVQLYD